MRCLYHILLLLGPTTVLAQVSPLPKAPTSFETRQEGSGNGGVTTVREQKRKITTVTYVAVTEYRHWTNAKGRRITAMLLVHQKSGEDKNSSRDSLIRDGKVRLLVKGRKAPGQVPLISLSAEDRKFITALDQARLAKNEATGESPVRPQVQPNKD